MISQLIKSAIGDILDLISELAPYRNQLVKLYNTYSHPLSFINKYMRDFPSSSRAWGGAIYRASRYFAKQEDFLPLQGFDTPLDPRLAGDIPTPFGRADLDYTYRYNIRVDITAPGVGQQHTFNFWLNAQDTMSEKEVLTAISPGLISLVDRYKLDLSPGSINSAVITSSQIEEFTRYMPVP